MDVLNPEQRRRNMSAIRGRDTKPEMQLRRGLHAAGLRYRLHVQNLPGRPDIVFPGPRAVVLVHGCFWHGHDCPLFHYPSTRRDFWEAKIGANRARDAASLKALRAADWRVLTVWECGLRGRGRRPLEEVIAIAQAFVRGDETERSVQGMPAARAGSSDPELGAGVS